MEQGTVTGYDEYFIKWGTAIDHDESDCDTIFDYSPNIFSVDEAPATGKPIVTAQVPVVTIPSPKKRKCTNSEPRKTLANHLYAKNFPNWYQWWIRSYEKMVSQLMGGGRQPLAEAVGFRSSKFRSTLKKIYQRLGKSTKQHF